MSVDPDSYEERIPSDVPHGLQSPTGMYNPFDWYRTKRSRGEIIYDADRNVYGVFSYDAVKTIFHDTNHFARPTLSSGQVEDDPLAYIQNAMVWSEEQTHDSAKKGMFEYFSPRALSNLEETIEVTTIKHLDAARTDERSFNFVEEIAVPVTLKIPMALLGIPERDYEQILNWIETFAEIGHTEYSATSTGSPSELAGLIEYFEGLITNRREQPQDDLISMFAKTDLETEIIGSNCFDILFAGQGTVTDFLSNALVAHSEHNILNRTDEVELEVALEEVLRYRSPIQSQARKTIKSVDVCGTSIPSGETVILWIGSANRDPDRYDDPDTFVLNRDPNHLAFGHGSHSCIGFMLARMEARIILQTFFDAFESISVHEDCIEPSPTPAVLAFDRLPVSVCE